MSEPLHSPWSSVDGVKPLPSNEDQENDMARHYYDILGEQVLGEIAAGGARPVVGTDEVGVDYGALVSAAANIAQTGIAQDKAKKDEAKAKADAEKAKSDSAVAVSKSISADAEWANAEANAELAAPDASAGAAARIMRDSAKSNALAAGAVLQGDGIAKRCKAAHDTLVKVAEAATASPKDIAKLAKFHGWQKVTEACGAPPATPTDTPEAVVKHAGGSWITAKHAGLPVYGWGLVGVGSLTALMLIIRSMRKKK